MPTTAASRTIRNPAIGDVVTFVETAAEDGRTLLDIELAPESGNAPHVHHAFDERFEVVEGQLQVRVGRERIRLAPGESAVAPAGAVHSFSNPTGDTVRFRVAITPGHSGFEQSLRIAYGLAEDGLVKKGGVPRSLSHIAVLVALSDTKPAGPMAVLNPLLSTLARRARARGIERELVERYG